MKSTVLKVNWKYGKYFDYQVILQFLNSVYYRISAIPTQDLNQQHQVFPRRCNGSDEMRWGTLVYIPMKCLEPLSQVLRCLEILYR